MKKISVLGSTGSIGTQTLQVIAASDNLSVTALSTNTNIDLLEKQIKKYNPAVAAVYNEDRAEELKKRLIGSKTKILSGIEGLIEAASFEDADISVISVAGNIGLKPTYEAVKNRKTIALATKEVLVSAGSIIMEEARRQGVKILPVDSEHSAIFQSLQGNDMNPIRKILLTASGGPFRQTPAEELKYVTVEDALKHPNWSMGKKITVDSASMMNKGLEVIEAKWLFNVEVDRIEVVVHPQSIVHSAVEYADGAVIAQMGTPDMRLPIAYALNYPERKDLGFERLDIFKAGHLDFYKPDTEKFKCLSLAYRAVKTGGTMPAVMNAANEKAVALFLDKKIGFTDIPFLIEKTMDAYTVKYDYSIDDIEQADLWARKTVKENYEKYIKR